MESKTPKSRQDVAYLGNARVAMLTAFERLAPDVQAVAAQKVAIKPEKYDEFRKFVETTDWTTFTSDENIVYIKDLIARAPTIEDYNKLHEVDRITLFELSFQVNRHNEVEELLTFSLDHIMAQALTPATDTDLEAKVQDTNFDLMNNVKTMFILASLTKYATRVESVEVIKCVKYVAEVLAKPEPLTTLTPGERRQFAAVLGYLFALDTALKA